MGLRGGRGKSGIGDGIKVGEWRGNLGMNGKIPGKKWECGGPASLFLELDPSQVGIWEGIKFGTWDFPDSGLGGGNLGLKSRFKWENGWEIWE